MTRASEDALNGRPDYDPPPKTEEQIRRENFERIRALEKRTHRVDEVSKLPTDARYWAVSQDSYTYDSGYGERGMRDMCTSSYLVITYFDDEEALEAWVLKAVEEKKKYKVYRASPVVTEVKAVFSLKV